MSSQPEFVNINISAIPVAGWGGAGLLAVAAVITLTFPEARLLVTLGLVGGGLIGACLIRLRRHRTTDHIIRLFCFRSG
jgi:hypothetical protein